MFPSQDCPLREGGDLALGVSRKELVVVSPDGQPILRAAHTQGSPYSGQTATWLGKKGVGEGAGDGKYAGKPQSPMT